MARVLIQCPRTGYYVYTGVETAPDALDLLPEDPAPVQCPFCHASHSWRRSQATLVDPTVAWSEIPRAEDCLQRAVESARMAQTSSSPRERDFYQRMEKKWSQLAKDFEFLAQLDRRHDLTGAARSSAAKPDAAGGSPG